MNLMELINNLPPEATYEASHALMRLPILSQAMKMLGPKTHASYEFHGKALDSPLGIGAGIDKDGLLMDLAAAMPIGFHVIGSVTPQPRSGNPRPRFIKCPAKQAMINAMGLPSRGAGFVLDLVRRKCPSWPKSKLLIISAAGFTVNDVIRVARAASGVRCVDYVEINISSPTYRGQWLEGGLEELIRRVHELDAPALIKVPLLSDIHAEIRLIELFSEAKLGLVIANTLPVQAPLSRGYGGLSGAPINPLVLRLIRLARRLLRDAPIIGIGGFMSGTSVMEGLRMGADLIGIVTAFALEGPLAIYRILRQLSYAEGKTHSLS